MRYLFIHPNFPSQHGPFAKYIASLPGNEVVFLTEKSQGEIPGVRKVLFQSFKKKEERPCHAYLRAYESAILQGQGAAKALYQLKKSGWMPDVVLGHAGWGATLFVRDLFPKAKIVNNFEWYYNAHEGDANFDPDSPLGLDDELRIRCKNATLLSDLAVSDAGIAPTQWQKDQFPKIFHPNLQVLHEGVEADYIRPTNEPQHTLSLPRLQLEINDADHLVTYVSRGLEPYRGFPQFMASLGPILEANPKTHVVIVGEDRVAYGKAAPQGTTYQKMMVEKYHPDPQRVHFTGRLSREEYLRVLQASSAHVYLTYPFVLSWSMVEAMSAACLLIGSNTPPVREVIEHGFNGLLVDFFDSNALAQTVTEALKNREDTLTLRRKARETVLHRFQQKELMPRRYQFLNQAL